MSNDKHIRLEHRDCLSEDMLQRYVNEQLSAKEKHLVEKHILGCDMCADALDGIVAMKDPSQLKNIVKGLNEKIRERSLRKPIVLWMDTRVRVAVAAGITLLIGFFVIFNNSLKNDTTVSDNLVLEKDKDKDQSPVLMGKTIDSSKMTADQLKDARSEGKDGFIQNTPGGNGPTSHTQPLEDEKKGEDHNIGTVKDLENSITQQEEQKLNRKDDQKPVVVNGGSKLDEVSGEDIPTDSKDGKKDPDAKFKKKSNEDGYVFGGESDKEVVVNSKQQTDDKTIVTKSPVPPKDEEKYRSVDQDLSKKDKKGKEEVPKKESGKELQNNDGNYEKNGDVYYSSPSSPPSNTTVNNNIVITETNKSTNGQGNTGNVNPTVTDNLSTITAPDNDVLKNVTDSTLVSVDMVLVQGKAKYNAKDYDGALVFFNQVLVYDASNREALYYAGASYLAKNNPDLAIASYDKVIAQGKGLLYDDARYDKSLALLKKNKNDEAKKILNDLIKEGGPYKAKASEKVK